MRYSGAEGAPSAAGDFGSRRVSSVLTSKGIEPIEGSTYQYDRNQNRTLRAQDVSFGPTGETQTNAWHYDALNRLHLSTRTRGPASFTEYTLDGRGNRTVVTTGLGQEVYVRDATQPTRGLR
jgi:hypothetical protein